MRTRRRPFSIRIDLVAGLIGHDRLVIQQQHNRVDILAHRDYRLEKEGDIVFDGSLRNWHRTGALQSVLVGSLADIVLDIVVVDNDQRDVVHVGDITIDDSIKLRDNLVRVIEGISSECVAE